MCPVSTIGLMVVKLYIYTKAKEMMNNDKKITVKRQTLVQSYFHSLDSDVAMLFNIFVLLISKSLGTKINCSEKEVRHYKCTGGIITN